MALLIRRHPLCLGLAGLALLVAGCGGAGGTTGRDPAQLTLSGEFSGTLATDRPHWCVNGRNEFAFDIVGTLGGHVLEVRLLVAQWLQPLLNVEGEDQVALPSGMPVATAAPSGGYPGDGRGVGQANSATLIEDLTTERHYLGGTVHVDPGGNSGSLSLGDSQVHLDGIWSCP
jgi:hypothetical protein